MGIRAREGHWHYRFQFKGREYTGSTGLAATARNKSDALKFAASEKRKLKSGNRSPQEKRFNDGAKEFLAWCENVEYRGKPNTARRIKTSFASLIVYFGDRAISDLASGDVEGFKTWRVAEHGVRDVTIRHDLDALSLFFQFGRKCRWCEGNPVTEVKRPSDADAMRIHVISEAEERAYFAEAVKSRNLFDVTRLILNQGCRPEEIMALRPADVDVVAKTVTIQGGKTRAARRVLNLTSESVMILARRVLHLDILADKTSKWVFPSTRRPGEHITKLNNVHDRVCREAGVSFCIYDFRHTFATRAAQAGVDLATLAKILGHSTLRMVMRYVHPTQEHQKAAMLKYERSTGERNGVKKPDEKSDGESAGVA